MIRRYTSLGLIALLALILAGRTRCSANPDPGVPAAGPALALDGELAPSDTEEKGEHDELVKCSQTVSSWRQDRKRPFPDFEMTMEMGHLLRKGQFADAEVELHLLIDFAELDRHCPRHPGSRYCGCMPPPSRTPPEMLRTLLGRSMAARGRLGEALEQYQLVLDRIEHRAKLIAANGQDPAKINAESKLPQYYCLRAKGLLHEHVGQLAPARDTFNAALNLMAGERINDTYITGPVDLARVCAKLGETEKAEKLIGPVLTELQQFSTSSKQLDSALLVQALIKEKGGQSTEAAQIRDTMAREQRYNAKLDHLRTAEGNRDWMRDAATGAPIPDVHFPVQSAELPSILSSRLTALWKYLDVGVAPRAGKYQFGVGCVDTDFEIGQFSVEESSGDTLTDTAMNTGVFLAIQPSTVGGMSTPRFKVRCVIDKGQLSVQVDPKEYPHQCIKTRRLSPGSAPH